MGCGQSARLTPAESDDNDEVAAMLAADVARAAAAAAVPLPSIEWDEGNGSSWHKLGGGEFEPLLAHTDLIDAAWLLKFANGEVMPERKGIVPAWQQVPPEAKVSLEQLRRTTMLFTLPIAVLSYGWATSDHPDSTGALLRRLVPVLEAMVHSCSHGTSPEFPSSRLATWGIVWDYMCLPQRGIAPAHDRTPYEPADDRTPYELARFRLGLQAINVWYVHPHTYSLVCDWPMPADASNRTPIDRRGWCIFERQLSCVRKSALCCLTLSRLSAQPTEESRGVHAVQDGTWHAVVAKCTVGRSAPQLPDEFMSMLRQGMLDEAASPGAGIRFTNGKDATEVCIPQYREAFFENMRRGGEVRVCPTARLSVTSISPRAVCTCVFATSLPSGLHQLCMPPLSRAWWRVLQLFFVRCQWGDQEVRQLVAALACAHEAGQTCQAVTLDLEFNQLTDASVAVLLELVKSSTLPRLQRLNLEHNPPLSDAGQLRALCEERGIAWGEGGRAIRGVSTSALPLQP